MIHPTPTLQSPAETLFLADERIVITPQATSRVYVDGKPAEWATPRRAQLLTALAMARDTYVSRENLAAQVYNASDSSSLACVNVHLSNIRIGLGEKLGDLDTGVIRTRKGIGTCAVSSLKKRIIPIVDEKATINIAASGRLITDGQTQTIYTDGQALEDITFTEFHLAHTITGMPDSRLSLPRLQEMLIADASIDSKAIPANISSLRGKLGPELGHAIHGAIRTQRQVGYYAVNSL